MFWCLAAADSSLWKFTSAANFVLEGEALAQKGERTSPPSFDRF